MTERHDSRPIASSLSSLGTPDNSNGSFVDVERLAAAIAASTRVQPVPRLALDIGEACEALGCSWDFFREHVAPDLRIVRRGRPRLVPVAELERWLAENAERAL